MSFTGSTITIKNVQKDGTIESYHRGSGFRPSENNMNFLDTEKGQTVLTTIQNFAKEVFAINYLPARMLMYGKEASNRKQEIDRQHYTIPNQRPKDKHCGKI